MRKYQEEVVKRADEIALAIAMDTGKPLWESKTEAAALAGKVNVTIDESLKRVSNSTIKNVMPSIDGHIIFKPLGPSVVIGPFNFPCHLANTQILSALLTGNSVIFKPSEKTVLSSEIMFECLASSFPKNVVNFIVGGAKTSSALCSDERIKGVFFTGSKPVGLKILEVTHKHLDKMVALELGGKNTTIIHEDVNIDHALAEVLRACFLTAGQRCTSTSMIAIHKKIEQEFTERFIELTKRIIIDHPVDFKREPFMGPVIDEIAVKKYEEICKQGEKEGAQALLKSLPIECDFKGHYVSPSIYRMEKVNLESQYLQTEIFGPNCTFLPYNSIDEAIDIANCTEYGLAASVFTQDNGIYQQCIRDIDSGLINLNRSTVGASARLPFGGVKSSGNHHPAAVSMIDATAHMISSLETTDESSNLETQKGLAQ
jgi:succinylglutamic semialdehyde dehydrogenase